MENEKKTIKKYYRYVLACYMVFDALMIMLGVFLFCKPELSVKVAGTLIGIGLLIGGVYAFVKFVTHILYGNKVFFGLFYTELIYAILSVVLSVMLLSNPIMFTNAIMILVAIWLLVGALFKGYMSLYFKKYNEETWALSLTIAILNIMLAILIFANPFAATISITSFLGIMILVYALMDIVQQLIWWKRANEIAKLIF